MAHLIGFLMAMTVMYIGYRLGPYVFDGFVARRYEELFHPADISDIDRRFMLVVAEYSIADEAA